MSVFYLEEFSPTFPEERKLVMMLHNNIYVFTSTVGTQTDTDVFYMNGKPARAVKPFRVVLKEEKAQSVFGQAEGRPQQADSQHEGIQHDELQRQDIQQHEDIQQDEELEEEEEQSEYEEEQAEEQDQRRVLEEPMLAAYKPGFQARQQLQSQETQTELRLLHRQLLRFTAGEAGSSSKQ